VLGVPPLLFASAAGAALLLIVLLSGYAGHRLARPIREVAAALERFETDAVVPDVGERGPREARVLSAAFRSMARRLSEQTTSIERLRAEVARRQAAEMRANLALADLQQAYEKSLQVEKLSALGTFVGGIAHEVKNPLMGLSNYIDHVRAELDDPELCGILDRALHQVRRIEHIVDGVLRYAGGERADGGALDLAAIVQDVIALLKSQIERGGVALTLSVPEPAPAAFGDRGVVEQALVNLVLNAAHAVRDRPRREVHIEVLAEPSGGAAIAVSDSGPGVPARLRQRIWEPFFTTKAPGDGTGLGLSVAAQNLSASGAALILDSGFGDGARFVIRLPGAPEEAPAEVVD
jgi:C4-dicarboxylate-specific signal transduction histidine kinase